MDQKPKKLPRTAVTLYVKLYCKKRNSSKSKYMSALIEAGQSWVSLSRAEKQLFFDKYKECQMKYKEKFISLLKNAEPFLKKRKLPKADATSSPSKDQSTSENIIENNEIGMLGESTEIRDNTCNESQIVEESVDNPLDRHQATIDVGAIQPKLTEPLPPTLKNGKDLFNLVKTSNDVRDVTWSSINQKEKSRYQRAILSLKKNYIRRYKAYLESLTPKELFEHYNSRTNNINFASETSSTNNAQEDAAE